MRLSQLAAPVVLLIVVPFALEQDLAPKLPSTEDLLTRPAGLPRASALSASSAFETLMTSAGIPGGEVLEVGCSGTGREPQVHLKGTTVKELLDSLVGDGSRYSWEARGGVVDLLPAKGPSPLLLTRLRTYDSHEAEDIVTATTFLFASPEVRDAAARLRLTQNLDVSGLGSVGPDSAQSRRALSLRLHDVTLLDVLNTLVQTNKHGVWTYRELRCQPKTYFDISISE